LRCGSYGFPLLRSRVFIVCVSAGVGVVACVGYDRIPVILVPVLVSDIGGSIVISAIVIRVVIVIVLRTICCVHIILNLCAAFFLRILSKQSQAIGNRDLVIVGMNFVEGEETMTVAAIFDKRRLKRGFDTRDFCKIDIAV
jgi:hypothetical protein